MLEEKRAREGDTQGASSLLARLCRAPRFFSHVTSKRLLRRLQRGRMLIVYILLFKRHVGQEVETKSRILRARALKREKKPGTSIKELKAVST